MSSKKLAVLGGDPEYSTRQVLIKPSLPKTEDILEDLSKIHNSTFITNGVYNRQFEEHFCEKFNVPYALTVNNATIGLMIALRALTEKSGEVILTGFTFPATGFSVLWNGLRPVFADIDPCTKNLDPVEVEKKINKDTVAIMPVYIFSNPPDIAAFEETGNKYGVPVLFDTAQGIGSQYRGCFAGGFGDVEVFSLAPTKVVTSVEGGIVTTSDKKVYEKIKALRDNGKTGEYDFTYNGLNARMTEYQAVVGLFNLKRLNGFSSHRKKVVDLYRKNLGDLPGIKFQEESPDSRLTYNYMVVFIEEEFGVNRDEVNRIFMEENIQTKKYFYPSLNHMEPFQAFDSDDLKETEKASATGLALPLYNSIPLELAERVCEIFHTIHRSKEFLTTNKH